MEKAQMTSRKMLLATLRSGPRRNEPIVTWLCRTLPIFDYERSHFEEVFGWLRSAFLRRWPGVHVIHHQIHENVNPQGIPSLGLILALTAPQEVVIAATEWSSLRSRTENLYIERVEHILASNEQFWCRMGPATYTRALLHGPMTFLGHMLSHAHQYAIEELTGTCPESNVEPLRVRLARWPSILRELPSAWIPTTGTQWPTLTVLCSRVRFPKPLSLAYVQNMLATDALDHVTHLEFGLGFANEHVAEHFFEHASFKNLKDLRILGDGPLGEPALRALARTRGFPQLQSLTIEYARFSETNCSSLLASSTTFQSIEHLALVEDDATPNLHAALPQGLSSLRVQTDEPFPTLAFLSDNPSYIPSQCLSVGFGESGAQLDLRDAQASYEQVERLLQTMTPPQQVVAGYASTEVFSAIVDCLDWDIVERLDVFGVGIDDDQLIQLLDTRPSSLEWLDLSTNNLTLRSIRALRHHPCAKNLRALHVAHTHVQDTPSLASALAEFESLLSLNVRDCRLDREAFRYLCAPDRLSRLVHLNLSANKLLSADLNMLADAAWTNTLARLNLSGLNLSDSCTWVQALSQYKHLKYLELSECSLSGRCIHALTQASWAKNLRWLNLSLNQLDRKALAALTSGAFPNLSGLSIGAAQLDSQNATSLISNAWVSRLEFLHLSGNQFTDDFKTKLRKSFGIGTLNI